MRLRDSSGRTNFTIAVSNGLLTAEHCRRLGGMTPLFLYLHYIDRTTRETEESDGLRLGAVNGGKPYTDGEIAMRFEQPKWRVRNCRRTLALEGYIRQKVTPTGPILYVNKSKKWRGAPASSGRRVCTPAVGPPANIGRTSYCQRSDKEDSTNRANKAAAAASSSEDLQAWKVLGQDRPFGPIKFTQFWESCYAGRNGRPLSEVMGECADRWQESAGKVPPPFFRALSQVRQAERREAAKPALDDIAAIPSEVLEQSR